jgi:hypothetical protein
MSTEGLEGKAGLPAVSSVVPSMAVRSSATFDPSGLDARTTALQRMAEIIVRSGIMPGIDTVNKATALMLLCECEGLHPVAALRRYHVTTRGIEMKAPAMYAEFQAAGGRVRWITSTDQECEAQFIHPVYAPDPGFPVRATLYDLIEKGVATQFNQKTRQYDLKSTYAQFPDDMLRATVIRKGVRAVCGWIGVGMDAPDVVSEVGDSPESRGLTAPVTTIQAPEWSMPSSREVRDVVPAITRSEVQTAREEDRQQINKEFTPTPAGQSLPPSKPAPKPAPAPEEPEPAPKHPAPDTPPSPDSSAVSASPGLSMAEKLAMAEASPSIVKPDASAGAVNYYPSDDPIRPDQMTRLRELVKQLNIQQDEWNTIMDEYGVPMPDTPLPGQPRTPRMAGMFSDEAADLIRDLEARLDRPEATFGDPKSDAPQDYGTSQAVLPGMEDPNTPAGTGEPVPSSKPAAAAGPAQDGDPRIPLILEGERLAGELGYTPLQLATEAGGDLAELEMPQLEQAVGRLRWGAQGKPGPDPTKPVPAGSFEVPEVVRPEPKRRGRPRKNPITT